MNCFISCDGYGMIGCSISHLHRCSDMFYHDLMFIAGIFKLSSVTHFATADFDLAQPSTVELVELSGSMPRNVCCQACDSNKFFSSKSYYVDVSILGLHRSSLHL